MSGETDLGIILRSMRPVLSNNEYIFYTTIQSLNAIVKLEPWAIIREEESLTLIVNKVIADENNFEYSLLFKRITLNIHSSLDAVGLTSVISTKLADAGISVNVVAGYYYDHIFVQSGMSGKAFLLLEEFSGEV